LTIVLYNGIDDTIDTLDVRYKGIADTFVTEILYTDIDTIQYWQCLGELAQS